MNNLFIKKQIIATKWLNVKRLGKTWWWWCGGGSGGEDNSQNQRKAREPNLNKDKEQISSNTVGSRNYMSLGRSL